MPSVRPGCQPSQAARPRERWRVGPDRATANQRMIAGRGPAARYSLMVAQGQVLVAVVDDDELMRGALQGLLREAGWPARAFASGEEFLGSGAHHLSSCLIADVRMPGMS